MVVGYRLNRLDEPVLMAVPKPMQTEFDIHHRLVSCGLYLAGTRTGVDSHFCLVTGSQTSRSTGRHCST